MSVEIQASVAVDLSGLEEFREAIDSQLNHQTEGPITKAFKQWIARYRAFIKERYDIYSKGGGNWQPLSNKTKWKRRSGKGTKRPKQPKLKVLKTGSIVHTKVKTRRGVSEHTVSAGKRKTKIANLNKRIGKLNTQKKYKGVLGFIRKAKEKRRLKQQISKVKLQSRKAKRDAIIKSNKKAKAAYAKAKKNYLKKAKFSILRDTNTLFLAVSPSMQDKPGALSDNIPFGVKVGFGGNAKHPKGKATIAAIAMYHQTGAGHLPVREIIVDPAQEVKDAMSNYMMRAIKELTKGGDDQVSETA